MSVPFRNTIRRARVVSLSAICLVLASCSGDSDDPEALDDVPVNQTETFELRFAAAAGDRPVACGDVIDNLGNGGQSSMEIGDLRMYISDVELLDAKGDIIEHTLDANEFQYSSDVGDATLIDLTDTGTGACAGEGLSYVEGTARSNAIISGMATSADIDTVRFTVGLPQALMQQTIAQNTAEGAPSPLNEMMWSWAYGYRFFVMNFVTSNTDGSQGQGQLHIGSTGCTGADGENALESIDQCSFLNTPEVELTGVTQESTIVVDVAAAVADLDFLSEVLDENFAPVINDDGSTALNSGVACHSVPDLQPDCGPVFANFGLSIDDGSASASGNTVFALQ